MARKTTKDQKEHSKTADTEQLPETHQILIDDKASKLSPKQPGFIYFELGKHLETNELELRLKGNDGGGLHSKEWVKLSTILEILDQQEEDKPFKSGVFKPVFAGKSANNASFIAAVLRCSAIALTDSTENSIFLHMLNKNFKSRREALLKLASSK